MMQGQESCSGTEHPRGDQGFPCIYGPPHLPSLHDPNAHALGHLRLHDPLQRGQVRLVLPRDARHGAGVWTQMGRAMASCGVVLHVQDVCVCAY